MEPGSADRTDDSLSAQLSGAAALLRTDPSSVVDRALQALERAPADAQALMLLVSAHRVLGNLPAARSVLQRLALAEPNLAAIQYELGQVLGESGEHEAAIDALARVVDLEPAHPEAWRALGDQRARAGRAEGAAEAYAAHLQVRVATLRRLEAAASRKDDKLPAAEGLLLDYLDVHPTAVAVRRMLAEVYDTLGRQEEATKQLQRCWRRRPGKRRRAGRSP